jgi:hypothetical protein
MTARALGLVLVAVPASVLTVSYLWLAVDHRTPWLLGVVVHESGRYTLAETILYFRHVLRELPIDVVYAAAAVAAAAGYGPRCTTAPARAVRIGALGAAALVVAGAWTGTVHAWGADVARSEVLQGYLRDEDVPSAGVHWGYHFLSTIAYLAAAIVLAALLRALLDGHTGVPRSGAGARGRLAGVVAAMIGLSALCGLGASPFRDPRYLGHQAREAGTHLLVTLPLSFAVLLGGGSWSPDPSRDVARRPSRDVGAALAVGAVTLAYLALGSALGGAADTARPGARLSSLVGAHYYEHTFDYVLVLLLVTALAPAATGRDGRAP